MHSYIPNSKGYGFNISCNYSVQYINKYYTTPHDDEHERMVPNAVTSSTKFSPSQIIVRHL